MSIGENIKRLRERAGISQEELAEKTHLSRSMVAKIETDRCTPSMVLGRDLANALGADIGELVK